MLLACRFPGESQGYNQRMTCNMQPAPDQLHAAADAVTWLDGILIQKCFLQNEADKLEHVGIIHHDSAGSPAFLHRTSGGKLDPSTDAYFTVDLITLPLSPKRAYALFEGAAETGNYRYPKDRFGRLVRSSGLHAKHFPSAEHEFFKVRIYLLLCCWWGSWWG